MTDRRSFDPYAPHLPRTTVAMEPAPEPVDNASPTPLEELPKAVLVDIAEQHGVATYGSKADLAERIRLAAGD